MSRWLSRLALPGAEFRAVSSMAKRDISPESLAILALPGAEFRAIGSTSKRDIAPESHTIRIPESVAMEVPAVEVPAIEVPAATKSNCAMRSTVAKMPGAMKPAVAENRACTDRNRAAVPNNVNPGMTRSLSLG